MTRGRSMPAPSRPLMESFSQSMVFEDAEAVGLGNVLRAAEMQRKAQIRRLQHLKLSAEKEAEHLRQAELRQAADLRREENIKLEKRYQKESLAIHRAETEAKRQQILYNNAMNEDAKRRTAEKKVQKVDRRVEKIKQQKEHEAWLRKKHAEDKELYRQEVLLRSVVLEAQKVESARAKEADLEAQLQQREAAEARQQRARERQRNLDEERRQAVMRRAGEEEEMRRYQHAQQLAEKEVANLRKQAEIEENTQAKKQQLRLRDEERRAKVAYAQHLDAVAAERNSKKLEGKMERARQIEAERELVLATMGRLRQEMSLQEDMYKETIHNMKVQNKYTSRNLVDLSASMTDVSQYLSPGRSMASGQWSTASSAGGSAGRPRNGPFRKSRPRSRSGTSTGTSTPRSSGLYQGPADASSGVKAGGKGSSARKGGSARSGSKGHRPTSVRAASSRSGPEPKKLSISRSALEEQPWDDDPRDVDIGKSGWDGQRHIEVYERPSSYQSGRKLTARQQELKAMIEHEQAKEHGRQATLKVVLDPGERERLVRLFAAEREEAKSAILALSCA